jgi:hypothetical protein
MTENAAGSGVAETLLTLSRERAVGQARRLSEARAREHVGAAGWAQASVLEQIIRAGQAQIEATDTLRTVVQLSTEQLRALTLEEVRAQAGEQDRTLGQIMAEGTQQVRAAESLSELIQAALDDVVRVPLSEVSVRHLEQIGVRVREQLESLQTLLASARAQAQTLSQLQSLDQVSRDHARRVDQLRSETAAAAAERLGQQGEAIVEAITELDEGRLQQVSALQGIGSAAVEAVNETGASRAEQLAALEAIARTTQEQVQKVNGS